MWLKFLLAALCVAFCTCVGYFAAEKYRARKKFFADMHAFNEKYLSELNYARKTLTAFLKESGLKGDFAELAGSASRAPKVKNGYLTAEERGYTEQYLGMLGRGDSHTQGGYFEAQRELLSQKRASSEKEAKERSELYLKLGFLAGLAFVILII